MGAQADANVPLTGVPDASAALADAATALSGRLPRMMAAGRLNLTWTRGGLPPRSEGWEPSAALRARLPTRDLKERYYRSCAVVGSGGRLRRAGHGQAIDSHEFVIRFNGAPAGGGWAADVGRRTSLSVLADVATTACIEGKARQPTLAAGAPGVERGLLLEAAPGWRDVHACDYYPEAKPPPATLFLPKRGGGRRLAEFMAEQPDAELYLRSDDFGAVVDAQIEAYRADESHPTSGFNGVVLALHVCETVGVYGFGSPRDKFFSAPRAEKAGSQHLYRTEMSWLLGLEQRFPGRVRVWP
jgi:hypothetical protein